MRVLVVEDSQELASLIAQRLEHHGYAVDIAADVTAADKALGAGAYAVVLLDLGLPDEDGLSWLKRLRARGATMPVIIVTARNGVQDRIAGLAAGADDYMVKPFDMDELVARIRSVSRRSSRLLGDRLGAANVVLDTRARQVIVGGAPCPCPAKEMMILELLLRERGEVINKRFIEDQLFGLFREVGPNTTEVYVYRLRKLLAAAGADVGIHTIRGVGYLLREEAGKAGG